MNALKLNKQLQESLHQSEENFRLLVESVQEYAIFMLDSNGYIRSWNLGAERIKGYRAEEIIGKHFSCFYSQEDIQQGKPEKVLQQALNFGRYEEEGWRIRKNGARFWANVVITPIRDNSGDLLGFAKVTRDMTERKIAEELRTNYNLLHSVIEGITDAVFVKDIQGRYLLINTPGASLLGKSVAEVIGKDDTELFNIFLARKIQANDRQILSNGETQTFEEHTIAAGITRTYLTTKTPYRDEVGNLIGLLGISRDISERKRMEDGLRRSEERYRAFIEQSSEGIWCAEITVPLLIDASEDEQIAHFYEYGYLAECNNAFARMYDFEYAQEMVGIKPAAMLVPSDPHNLEYLRNFIRSGYQLVDAESHEIDKQGKPKYFLNNLVGTVENGVLVRIWGTQRDITVRKQVEAELEARTRQQEAIASLGQLALSTTDLDVLFAETVKVIAKVLDNEYCKVLELLPDGEALLLRQGVGWQAGLVGQATVGTGIDSQAGYTLLSQYPVIVDDLRTETRFYGPPLLFNHGVVSGMSIIIAGYNRPWGVLGTHTTKHQRFTQDDINFFQAAANILAQAIERQRVEAQLHASQRRYFTLAEHAPVGIFHTDEQGKCLYTNSGWSKITGMPTAQALGEGWIEALHPENRDRILNQWYQATRRKQPWQTEILFQRPDSSVCWVIVQSVPEIGDSGEVIGYVGTLTDISERKLAEVERAELLVLEQAARAEADRSLALLNSFLANAPIGLAFFDPQLRCVKINQYIATINGIPIESTLGHTLREYLPEFADLVEPLLQKVLETGEAVLNLEISGATKAPIGEQHILANYYPVYSKEGQILGIGIAVTDITALKQTQQKLQEQTAALIKQQEWLEDVLNLLPIPLLFIEPNSGKVTFANRAADEMAGGEFPKYKPSQEYHTVYYCTDAKGDRIPAQQLPAVRVAQGERIEGVEADWHTPGGIRSVIVCGDILPAMHGHPAIGVVVFQDISKLKQTEKALFERNERLKLLTEQLQTANQMKDEFLAVVSHELRSPLNAILGWATMLRSDRLNESTKVRALETIERNARLQTQLIEDLLDVSRIITGKLRLNIQSIELCQIIEAAIDTVRPAADAKQIQIHFVQATTVTIKGDSARLQQIIWNLLSNAIKFTPTGGQVEVRLSVSEAEGVENKEDKVNIFHSYQSTVNSHQSPTLIQNCLIQVIDTGIGISPEFLPFVFERFRQADATTTRSHGGLGLGLAIVRHLVEMHGGTVSVSSQGKGQGATFSLKLPLQQEIEQHPSQSVNSKIEEANNSLNLIRQEAATSLNPNSALAGIRVLVVDDEVDTRDFMSIVLKANGANVRTVESVQAALETIPQWQPDVLLSDIGMPQEDGYSLIYKLRRLPVEQGGTIPAAALTAYAREEERQRALNAGFQKHLSKPIEQDELISVILSLISSQGDSTL